MSRLFPMLCALATLSTAGVSGFAAEPPLAQEVHELRRDLQLQGRKLDTLSQQIADLTRIIQERDAARPSPEPATTPVPPPAAAPIRPATGAKPTPAAEPEIPKAEAVPPPIQHVVEKGETLTSIAKHYNIPLADLLNLNKNTNDRRLQIGQTLKVPPPKPAPTEPSAEKKDNP